MLIRILFLHLLTAGMLMAASVNVTVNTSTPKHAAIGGFGFQMDGHYLRSFNVSRGMTEAKYNDIVAARWRDVSPGFARIGIHVNWWEPTEGTKTWNSDGMKSFIKNLELMQSTGTEVYLTTWYHAEMPAWLGGGYTLTTAADQAKFARTHVDLFEYLIKTKGFTNIKWYCMANELQTADGWAVLRTDMATFKAHHQAIYDELVSRSLDDDIGLLSTDQSGFGWTTLDWARSNMDNITGIYGGHYFESSMKPDNTAFYAACLSNLTDLSADAATKSKNFVIGEFGCGRNGGTWECFWRDDPDNGLMLSEYLIAALNAGAYAMSAWCYSDMYYNETNLMQWGVMFSDVEDGFQIRPAYYAYGLMTKYFRPNSSSFGATSSNADLRVGAARTNSSGHYSIAVVNRGTETHTANITLSGTSASATLKRFVYNTAAVPTSDGLQAYDGTVALSGGSFSDNIPPNSLIVYTSLDGGTPTQKVGTPSISPDGGSHDAAVQVSLSTTTSGAQIRYTTNGSSPTSSSTLYSAPFTVSSSATVKAKAFKSGMDDSNESSATFTITIDTDGPTITSATAAGTPTSVQVTFNEQLDETSAETAGNYTVDNGISVTGAILQSDGQTVLLTTGTLSEDVTYTVTVNNVEDLSGNRISSNAQTTFSYLDAIPDMGAWWKFNETGGTTALDASGNGNEATINGATRVAGIAGNALSFDGIDDYVDAGTFDPSTGDMTIAAWLNWKGTNGAHQVVIAKRDGWDAAEMRWQLARSYISNKVAFQQKNSSALFATDFPSTDAWFHVAVIKSGSTVKIYFDGVEAGSGSMDFGTKTDARIYLGASAPGSESFNGMMDDVRIYNRALAVSELAAVMDTSTGGGTDTTVSVITASVPVVQPNAVTVTPNPVSSYAVFKLPSTIRGNAHISIFNAGGELVNAFTVNGSKAVWNGTDQYGAVATPGVYLYRMQSGNTVMNGIVYKTN